jgi:hypothetical protein
MTMKNEILYGNYGNIIKKTIKNKDGQISNYVNCKIDLVNYLNLIINNKLSSYTNTNTIIQIGKLFPMQIYKLLLDDHKIINVRNTNINNVNYKKTEYINGSFIFVGGPSIPMDIVIKDESNNSYNVFKTEDLFQIVLNWNRFYDSDFIKTWGWTIESIIILYYVFVNADNGKFEKMFNEYIQNSY